MTPHPPHPRLTLHEPRLVEEEEYRWEPPPDWPTIEVPPSSDLTVGGFMLCSGQAILVGMSSEHVLALCGPPTSSRQLVSAAFAKRRVVDVWSYEQAGAVTRELRFEHGFVTALF